MSQAWKILLALTFARISMGVQFQAIPALAIPLTASGEMSFVALGTLTGAYLLPGAVVALVGGWLAHRVGDARVAFAGLGLMTVGGFAGWAADSYEAAVLWRLVAGIGAVGLNVMLTKMAADWFDGRDDLTTAMGVLVSSWPAGIAIAALILPLLAAAQGVQTALLVPAVICAIGWAGLWLIWKEPKRAVKPAGAAETSGFTGREITGGACAARGLDLRERHRLGGDLCRGIGRLAVEPGAQKRRGCDHVVCSFGGKRGRAAGYGAGRGGGLGDDLGRRGDQPCGGDDNGVDRAGGAASSARPGHGYLLCNLLRRNGYRPGAAWRLG